jgi:hypothetical protein
MSISGVIAMVRMYGRPARRTIRIAAQDRFGNPLNARARRLPDSAAALRGPAGAGRRFG